MNSTYAEAVQLLSGMVDDTQSVSSEETTSTYQEEEEILSNSFQARENNKLNVQQPQFDASQPPNIKPYHPLVIPIVKSKKSMVIVGAILREDLEKAVQRLKNIMKIARKPPVSLSFIVC